MNLKQYLLTVLALTLPLAGAIAQTTNKVAVTAGMLSASSVYNGYTPITAFDGSLAQNSGWTAMGGVRQAWLAVDFGAPRLITRVRVFPDRYIATDPSYSYLDRFRVEVWSNDTWQAVTPLIATPAEIWHPVDLNLTLTKMRLWCESDGNGPQVKEIEIYEVVWPPPVVFTTNATIAAGDTTYDGQSIVVSNCTLTVNGPHSFASLLLTNGAVLNHSPAPSGETNNRLLLTITGDAAVDATSRIEADGRGFGSDGGPGSGAQGGQYMEYASGGAYGGRGGSSGGMEGGLAYGSFSEPELAGSGGARRYSSQYLGGAGGGVVRLQVAGRLLLNGAVSANGMNGTGVPGQWGGAGGSGGSVWLTTGTLDGSGSIVASGGDGHIGGGATAGGGSGGRIAIVCGTNTFGGMVRAVGGTGGQGAAGTVYRKTGSEPYGSLLVDNGGQDGAATPLGRSVLVDLTIANRGAVYPESPLLLAGLRLATNGCLFQASGGGLDLTVLGDAFVDSTSRIDADGRGFGSDSGPGAGGQGGMYMYYASGAGHGGRGGYSVSVPGGAPYGSPLYPATAGSGGARRYSSTQWLGGAGGGTIRLTVGGLLQVDGRISAAGLNGLGIQGTDSGGGGGAGGSVWLTVGSLAGSGEIAAPGGNGAGAYGGGGGGGRIAIYRNSGAGPVSPQITVIGGLGWEAGTGGSYHLSDSVFGLEVATMVPDGTTLRSPVASCDIAFNQPLSPATFTAEDVVLTTPGGVVPADQLTLERLHSTLFRVSFPAQAAIGAYQVQVGQHVENLYGQEMAAAYTGSFTITNPAISGFVRWTGTPLAGVLLNATGGLSTSTGTNGAFTLSVPPSWTGTVTPTLAGWVFTPPSFGYANLAADATNQNFTASLAEPTVLRATVSGGSLNLRWPSAVGLSYQLQSATDLPTTNWLNEGPPFPGMGGVLATNLPVHPESRKFFRLQSAN